MNKMAGLIVMATMAGTHGWAGEIEKAGPLRVVTICMERASAFRLDRGFDIQLFPLAQAMASKLFATAGVRVNWHGLRVCPATAIFIRVSTDPKNRQSPGAFAYALPYDSVHIMIFCDRVQKAIEPDGVPYVMAYVLVHEVAHVLQGVVRHSNTGIMKAKWSWKDLDYIACGQLVFTEEDAQLIHLGLASRSPQTAATLRAR